LKKSGQPLLVIEVADISSKLRDDNFEVIAGNAARSDVLKVANLAGARYLLIAIPEAFEAGQIVQQARAASIRLVSDENDPL
jgi:CPA2 family monovalent cation:H+ antiporter-2